MRRVRFRHAPLAAIFTTYVSYAGTELTAIAIGDVSGKGAPAAIYEALVSGILRSHAAEKPGAAEMLKAINLSLAERPIAAQFVSIIYALWNENDMSLRIANSGLPHPYRCRNGKAEPVEISGLPLGLFAAAEYDEITLSHVAPAMSSCSSATEFRTPRTEQAWGSA